MYYFKDDVNGDYSLRTRVRQKSEDRNRFRQEELWDSVEEKWSTHKKQEMVFNHETCEHEYIIEGYMGFVDLEEPITVVIDYLNNCSVPWIDKSLPNVYGVDNLKEWTREKKVSGSVTTYTDWITHKYSPTYEETTYREKTFVDDKLIISNSTHTDWGYLERINYQYNEDGDVSRRIVSNLSEPGGEWFRRDTTDIDYHYFDEKLFKRQLVRGQLKSITDEKYFYDCEGRLISKISYFNDDLNSEEHFTYTEEPVCVEKEHLILTLTESLINTFLTFRTNIDANTSEVIISSITGQVTEPSLERIDQFTYTIDLSNYPSGVYFLTVACDGLIDTKVIVKI